MCYYSGNRYQYIISYEFMGVKCVMTKEKSCMVITSNATVRKSITKFISEYDMRIYVPEDMHNAYGYLFENNIEFIVIDIECWNNTNIGLPGFAFAEIIRGKLGDVRKPIIFVSKDENNKLFAYEKFNCIDYVLKPVDRLPLMAAVRKALIFSDFRDHRLQLYLKTNNTYVSVYIDDITYIDVIGRNVYFHYGINGEIEINNSHLYIYSKKVKKHGFIQIRRDTMINTKYIDSIDFVNGYVRLKNNQLLNIGGVFEKNLREYISRYDMFGLQEC